MGSVVRASRMTALPTSRRPTRAAVASAVLLLLAAPMAAAEPLAPGAASCLACHEADGAFPALGSLSARAIEDALAAYRSGARDGTVMPRIAKGFSDSDSRAIARSLGGGTAGR